MVLLAKNIIKFKSRQSLELAIEQARTQQLKQLIATQEANRVHVHNSLSGNATAYTESYIAGPYGSADGGGYATVIPMPECVDFKASLADVSMGTRVSVTAGTLGAAGQLFNVMIAGAVSQLPSAGPPGIAGQLSCAILPSDASQLPMSPTPPMPPTQPMPR